MSSLKNYGRYGSVGLELLMSMGLGFYAGQWLDKRYFGARGIASLIGFFCGTAVGFRALWKAAQAATREAEEEARRERDPQPSQPYQDEYLRIARKEPSEGERAPNRDEPQIRDDSDDAANARPTPTDPETKD